MEDDFIRKGGGNGVLLRKKTKGTGRARSRSSSSPVVPNDRDSLEDAQNMVANGYEEGTQNMEADGGSLRKKTTGTGRARSQSSSSSVVLENAQNMVVNGSDKNKQVVPNMSARLVGDDQNNPAGLTHWSR